MLLHQLTTLLGALHLLSETIAELLATATRHTLNEMVLCQRVTTEKL